MEVLHSPWLNALLAFMVNLPFGYWRTACRKLSASWFMAIHIPVILTIALRLSLGVKFRLVTLPLYVLAFAGGQMLGSALRKFHSILYKPAVLTYCPRPGEGTDPSKSPEVPNATPSGFKTQIQTHPAQTQRRGTSKPEDRPQHRP